MVHTLRLDNYSTTPRKLVLGTNSSFGTESIKIERGAGWDGLNLTATWHIPGREEPLRVALLDGDAMDVPPEVTKEAKDGVLVLAGLASGVQRASCNVEYLILEQAGVYGGTDAEPTPELAAQVLEATMQAKANAEAAAQDASESKANANKAQQAAENAAADAAKAGPYTEAALNAKKAAEAARDTAIAAGSCAENAANAAAGAMTAAAESASKAAASEKAAAAIAIAAAGSATQAEAQKTAAAKAASDAQGYMQAASSAATAANASAENAAGSKAAAASSATASANSATAAAASATTASAKATEAADSASAAAASEQAAAQAAEIAQDAAESLQPEVDQIKEDLSDKIDKPSTAPAVGKILKVTAVNDDGTFTCEWADAPSGGGAVDDVQVNGVSIVQDGVANIPVSSAGILAGGRSFGVVRNNYTEHKLNRRYQGINIANGSVILQSAVQQELTERNGLQAVTASNVDIAVKTAMCDGKGDAWTAEEQAAARERIGVENWETVTATLDEPAAMMIVNFAKPIKKARMMLYSPALSAKHNLRICPYSQTSDNYSLGISDFPNTYQSYAFYEFSEENFLSNGNIHKRSVGKFGSYSAWYSRTSINYSNCSKLGDSTSMKFMTDVDIPAGFSIVLEVVYK